MSEQYSLLESGGIALGTGACKILNALNDKSASFDKEYASKSSVDHSVGDILKNVVNNVYKVGTGVFSVGNKVIHSVMDSKPVKAITSSVLGGITSAHSKVDQIINKWKTNLESNENSGFGSFIKTLGVTAASAAHNVVGLAGTAVSKVSDSLDKQSEAIKQSDAYQKLVSARDKMDAETETKKNPEFDYGTDFNMA